MYRDQLPQMMEFLFPVLLQFVCITSAKLAAKQIPVVIRDIKYISRGLRVIKPTINHRKITKIDGCMLIMSIS